jgi:tetratricopeptide (TPR) repeat protein
MKIKYFDRAIEILFLALMFLIPVIFDRRIGIVFSGTKSVFLRTIVIILVAIWFLKLALGGKHIFRRTIGDWPILAYLLAVCAATITSVNFIISFWGFYGRYEGLATWICFGIMFFITTNYFRGFIKLKRLLAIIIPTATTMAVYGIIQRQELDPYAWGGVVTWQRVIATIGQPNFLAAYMIMAFFMTLYFLLESEHKVNLAAEIKERMKSIPKKIIGGGNAWHLNYLPIVYFISVPAIFVFTIYSLNGLNVPVWYLSFILMIITAVLFALNYEKIPKIIFDVLILISLAVNYICLFYTQSRGGFLGFLVGGVLFIMLLPKELIINNWKKLAILFALITIISGVTIVNPTYSPFQRFTSEIKVEGSSQDNAPADKTEQIKKQTVELAGAAGSRGETWKSAAGIIADNPVFGIGPEVLKMVFPRYETELFRFKEAFHVKQDRCHNETFDVPVTKGMLGFFLYLIVLITVYYQGFKTWGKSDPQKKLMLAALLAAMTGYLIQNQFSFGVIAITSLFWVLWAMVLNIDSELIEEDKKEITGWDIPYLPIALIVLALVYLISVSFSQFRADLYFKAGKSLSESGDLSAAIPLFEKSIKIFPYEGGTITHYGITLLNLSQRSQGAERIEYEKKAFEDFDFGMKVDPYNADNFYIVSRIYIVKGEWRKAIEYAEKALKIDPYYAEAHLTIANAKEKMGQMGEAQVHYDLAYKINPNLVEPKIRIAQKLIDENKLDEAFNLLQEMLSTDPKNPEVHKALGTIYLKRGDKARAKEEFEWSK